MTENKRYKVAIYDEKAIGGYCVLDLENPSQTARLKYNNVFIGTKDGCNIVCNLLNEQEEKNMQLRNQIKIFELFLDCNNLDIEWDLFCTKEDWCPFTDASCQECIYLGISDGD